MSPWAMFAIGLAAGIGVVVVLNAGSEGSCCKRVSDGVREKVRDKLGGTAQSIGDTLGLWSASPTLLDLFGVK